MKSIGIDIGTTTISIVVTEGDPPRVKERATLSNGSSLPSGHPWERAQDPDAILRQVKPALDRFLAGGGVGCIGLTGQMHGILYVGRDGRALSPLYTWQDGRGDIAVLQGKSACQLLREQGVKTVPGYGTATHLYNRLAGAVPSNAASFCTIADYVGMALTGRDRPLLHTSQAASLGLFDGVRRRFCPEAAQGLFPDAALFPAVSPELETLGRYRGVPVTASLGDNQASFLGSVRRAGESLLVNVGTGSQISLYSPAYWEGPGIEARPFLGDSFLLVGAALCGGAAYAALEGFFREYAVASGGPDVPQYAVMARLLEKGPAQAWQVRTTFSGTREDPAQAGSIQGIRLENFHPASLVRGVLWGMAEELAQLYHTVRQGTGLRLLRLVAAGNGVRQNPALGQIIAQRFHMPLTLVENQEEAAFGAALGALAANGQLSFPQWLGL